MIIHVHARDRQRGQLLADAGDEPFKAEQIKREIRSYCLCDVFCNEAEMPLQQTHLYSKGLAHDLGIFLVVQPWVFLSVSCVVGDSKIRWKCWPVHHGDLPEFIDFEYLRKNTAMNLSNLSNLAKAPAKPEEVKVDVKKLGNTSFLYWKAPKTGTVKGYYILVRETTSAVWQKKIFTTDKEITLPFSKDNYFFAVQAVNEAGNESLPVVPAVGR